MVSHLPPLTNLVCKNKLGEVLNKQTSALKHLPAKDQRLVLFPQKLERDLPRMHMH